MNRYILGPRVGSDLDDIIVYLRQLPIEPANRIGRSIRAMLRTVSEHPYQGFVREDFSTVYGKEVRCRIVGDFLVFYVAEGSPRKILGVIHGKRDVNTLMLNRLRQ